MSIAESFKRLEAFDDAVFVTEHAESMQDDTKNHFFLYSQFIECDQRLVTFLDTCSRICSVYSKRETAQRWMEKAISKLRIPFVREENKVWYLLWNFRLLPSHTEPFLINLHMCDY